MQYTIGRILKTTCLGIIRDKIIYSITSLYYSIRNVTPGDLLKACMLCIYTLTHITSYMHELCLCSQNMVSNIAYHMYSIYHR